MQTESTKQDTASLATAGNLMKDGCGIVRPLSSQDFEAVHAMIEQCVSTSPVGGAIVTERETVEKLLGQLEGGQSTFGFVAEDVEGLCGFILALEAPCLWNAGIKTAHVAAWWVEQRARDTTADSQLLQAVENVVRRHGASVILCGGEPWGVDATLSQRMLMAHGYDVMEPQRFKVLL